VSNTKPIVPPAAVAKKAPAQPNNKEAAVTALTASAKEEAPAAQAVPNPPAAATNGHSTATSAAEPVKVSPPAPPAAASTQKPLEVQKPSDSRASTASEHDDAPASGFFCCGAKPRKQTNDSKQYDRV
jgi:hypothetical protein